MAFAQQVLSASLSDIASTLDAMSEEERVAAARSLGRAAQMKLWELAAEAEPLTLDDFVRPDTPEVTEVIHEGRNTLPLFTQFQKRFCRPADARDRLFGYNEGATRGLIGPGYFVAVETASNPEWATLGGVVIDYFRVPQGPVPDAWPTVVPNEQGLQKFVYARTRDFMRRVSRHVSIGRAYKNDKALGAWFVLCRRGA